MAQVISQPAQTAATGDEPLYEVVNGQRRELEPIGAYETALASVLSRVLGSFVDEHKLGLVVTETLFVLNTEQKLQRRPDVAFVSYPRWPDKTVPRAEAWNVIPDLAVEVVSPTNLAEDIDSKLTDYFAAGVQQIWVVYPESRRVYVYESPTRLAGLAERDELEGGDVLPGFRLQVADLFAAVTKPD